MEKLRGKAFVLLGVNTDHELATAQAAMKNNRLPFRSWADGSPDGPICKQWNIRAFPTWYLIDQKGAVYARDTSPEVAEPLIEALLAR